MTSDPGPRVRPARVADADAIAGIYRPVVQATHVSFELEAPSAAEIERRMSASDRYPWLVADSAGEVVGYAYASSFRSRPAYEWTVETSVYVEADRQGLGIGTALVQALLDDLRARGYRRAIAGIALPNEASVALHERMGFTPVGVFREVGFKFDRWWSVGFWERAL